MSRRLMLREGSESIECPYIKDGLILWLDGYHRGDVNGKWKDLIGGKIFDLFNVTEETDGVRFKGVTTSYGYFPTKVSSNCTFETIEACYISSGQNGNHGIFVQNHADSSTPPPISCIRGAADNLCYAVNGTKFGNYNPQKTANAIRTLSMNDAICYANFKSIPKGTGDSWYASGSFETFIGKRSNSLKTYLFYGIIHSIRIYNRKLNANEMLENQAIDNDRFNLGLQVQ